MKLALVIILSLCCYTLAQSQVANSNRNKIVGRCMSGPNILAQLSYEVTGFDTVYTFSLQNRNHEYEPGSSIRFTGNNSTVDRLYTTLKYLIFMRKKKRRDYTTTMALSGNLVVFATSRESGNTSLTVYLPQGSNTLTEWQLDKLFGK